MGFKINTEIKPLNETDIKLMSQTELEQSLKRLGDNLKQQYVSRGLSSEDTSSLQANNINAEVIAKMNAASALM